MNIIRKDATITVPDVDEDFPGTFQVILSAPTLDRDGDTLLPEEWKQPLPDKITFDIDHGMSVASVVGSGTPWLNEKGQLVVDGVFSSLDRGQETRTLVKEGHIDRTSVAYITTRSKGVGGGAKVTRELLNGAFVAIPSNREAVVLASKAFQLKAGARNNSTDKENIQKIHDLAIALGADSDLSSETDDDNAKAKSFKKIEIKSLEGSVEALQDRASNAVQDAYPGRWAYVQATMPSGDGAGQLVYMVEDPVTYEGQSYQQDYTDDGTTMTLTGDPTAVDLMQVVKPVPDENAATSGAATGSAAAKAAAFPADAPVAKAAAPSPADVAAQWELKQAEQAIRLRQKIASTYPER
jgi:hypothetical protein